MANVNRVKYCDWMTALGDHAVILTHCTDWIVNYYSNERCVKIHTPEHICQAQCVNKCDMLSL